MGAPETPPLLEPPRRMCAILSKCTDGLADAGTPSQFCSERLADWQRNTTRSLADGP